MSGNRIVVALTGLAESMHQTGDFEHDHGAADDCLIEAIRVLAAGRDTEIKDAAERVIAVWNGLEKWFS